EEVTEKLLELLLVVDREELVSELDLFLLAQLLVHHPRLEFLELEFLVLVRAGLVGVFELRAIDVVHGCLLELASDEGATNGPAHSEAGIGGGDGADEARRIAARRDLLGERRDRSRRASDRRKRRGARGFQREAHEVARGLELLILGAQTLEFGAEDAFGCR